jgi:protein-disulfide isomerase
MQSYDTKQIVTWGAVIGGIIALFVGLVYLGGQTAKEPLLTVPVNEAVDRIKGNIDAKTTLIEYSDFQCPACAQYEPIVKQILETYPEDLLFVYRHYPLVQIHRFALPAAEASEAANKQGKFWEMHDLLFERQNIWSKAEKPLDLFVEYAKELGLDESKFTSDLKADDIQEKINTDMSGAVSSGITGTPTFFLNGKKIAPRSLEEFKSLIDIEIARFNQ